VISHSPAVLYRVTDTCRDVTNTSSRDIPSGQSTPWLPDHWCQKVRPISVVLTG